MADLTFESAINLFVKALQKKGKSTNTIVAYKGDLNQLTAFLVKATNLNDTTKVESSQIEDFKKEIQEI